MNNRSFISCFSDAYEGIDFVSMDGLKSQTLLLYSSDKSEIVLYSCIPVACTCCNDCFIEPVEQLLSHEIEL